MSRASDRHLLPLWAPTGQEREFAEIVAGMSTAEMDSLRKLVERDAFPLNAMNLLQRRYHLTEGESTMALELVCKTGQEASR